MDLEIWQGDITTLAADAIVNAANKELREEAASTGPSTGQRGHNCTRPAGSWAAANGRGQDHAGL